MARKGILSGERAFAFPTCVRTGTSIFASQLEVSVNVKYNNTQ